MGVGQGQAGGEKGRFHVLGCGLGRGPWGQEFRLGPLQAFSTGLQRYALRGLLGYTKLCIWGFHSNEDLNIPFWNTRTSLKRQPLCTLRICVWLSFFLINNFWLRWVFVASTAVAAKSLQSCPTLCDTTDGSPPGSPVPGTLQARTLEWVAISLLQCMKVKSESEVTQSCPTLSDPMDCSLPGSSVHGIFSMQQLEGA